MADVIETVREYSPIGSSHEEGVARRAQDPEYRASRARYQVAETCARELIRYRMQHGMTQAQLACFLGMPAPAVSRLERGDHVPNIATLQRVAHAFGKLLDISFVDPDLVEA